MFMLFTDAVDLIRFMSFFHITLLRYLFVYNEEADLPLYVNGSSGGIFPYRLTQKGTGSYAISLA